MLNPVRPTVAILLVSALGGCSFPGRDNPNDPQNAPIARLRVVDLTVDPAGSTSVAAAGRGHVLALDARATRSASCPDCPSFPTDVSYRFEILSPSACLTGPLAALATNQALAIVPHCLLTEAAPNQAIDFRVVVRTSSGGTGTAQTSIVPLNSSPTAAIEPARSLPVGGFPWNAIAGAASIPVDIVGSGSDPDEDVLHYHWTVTIASNGYITTTSPPVDAPSVHVEIPTVQARVSATLRVDDGNETSLPVTTTVTVGTQPIWTRNGEAGQFEEIDTIAQPLLVPANYTNPVPAYLPAELPTDLPKLAIEWFDQISGKYRFQVTSYPQGTAPVTLPAGGAILSDREGFLAADAKNSRVWATAGTDIGSGHTRQDLHVFDVDRTSTAYSETQIPALLGQDLQFDPAPALTIGGDGTCWIASSFSGFLSRAVSTGAGIIVTPILNDPSILIGGISARPPSDDGTPSDEVWVLEAPTFIGGVPPNGSQARLARYRPNAAPDEFDIGHDSAFGLAFATHDELWVTVADIGLVRVNIAALELGATFEQATLLSFPDVAYADSTYLVADPVSGDVWCSGFQSNAVYRASGNGIVSAISAPYLGSPFFFGDDGLVVFRIGTPTGYQLRRGTVPASTGVAAYFTEFALAESSYDMTTGGVWVNDLLPDALVRRGVDGRVRDYITRIQKDGNPSWLVPLMQEFRASPDSSSGYGTIYDSNKNIVSFDRFDLRTSPPSQVPFLDGPTANDIERAGFVFEPSAPVPSSTPFAWIVRSSTGEVATVATNGTPIVTRLTLPAAERPDAYTSSNAAVGALSSRSNKLCLATLDPANSLYHVRRIDPTAGAAEDFGTLVMPVNHDVSVGTFSNASLDLCAVAVTQTDMNGTTQLKIWRTASVIPLDITVAGDVRSIALTASNQVWLTVNRPDSFGAKRTYKERLTFSGGVATSTFDLDPNIVDPRFIAPGSRGPH